MPESVLIAGYYGYGNLGDEAILDGMLHDLRALEPDLRCVVASVDPRITARDHGVIAVNANDLPEVVSTMRECDIVLLGGGGLFHDYWDSEPRAGLGANLEGLAYYAAIPLLARMLGKRCMIYAAGIGPLRTEASRRLTQRAFELAQRSTVRDHDSLDLLRSIGVEVSSPQVEVTADPAFSLSPAPAVSGGDLRSRLGIGPETPLIGVCLRNWDIPGLPDEWEVEVAEGILAALHDAGAQAVLIPFQQRPGWSHTDDRSIATRFRQRLGGSLSHLAPDDRLTPSETASLFTAFTCVLTMRLHAALFATEAGVPAVSLACDPKLEHFMSSLKIGERSLTPDRWQRQIVRESIAAAITGQDRDALRESAGRLRLLSQANARIAIDLLHEPPPMISRPEAQIASLALEQVLSQVSYSRERDRMMEQMELIASERNRLEEQVTSITDTFGFRLLDAYWSAVRRIFPPSSKAKRVYRLATGLLRRGVRTSQDSPSSDGSQASSIVVRDRAPRPAIRASLTNARPSSDARLELTRFAARAEAGLWKSIIAIVSPVQLIESEGQRATNLALELAERGHGVVFAYWRWDTSPWAAQEQLGRGIVQLPIDVLTRHPRDLLAAFPGLPRRIVYEFPHPSLFALNSIANAEGWVTIYDVIDDWQEFHRAGQAPWYDTAIEEHLACAADIVLTVNEPLAKKVRRFGRDETEMLPNAARAGIQGHEAPSPLERGEITLGYFGHLSDAWFDWRLLNEVARMRPQWRLYLIGYGMNKTEARLGSNVTFLGKMPPNKLAAYAENWDAGIVPFVEGGLAVGADAIKTYEYLAMDLAVVVSGVYPPVGADRLVLRAKGPAEFVAKVEQAVATRRDTRELRRQFVESNTWAARTERLLRILEADSERAGIKRALFNAQ